MLFCLHIKMTMLPIHMMIYSTEVIEHFRDILNDEDDLVYTVWQDVYRCGWLGMDECESSPCEHDGTCNDLLYHYTCSCDENNYNGYHCENEIDWCFPPTGDQPDCGAHGNCSSIGNRQYTCLCETGYANEPCEDIDECEMRDGTHQHQCSHNSVCDNTPGGYTCSCHEGYTGQYCDSDINYCEEDVTCNNRGACVDGVTGYTCDCADGYEGHDCETDIDECATSPCNDNAECIDEVNSYACVCATGYTGPNCDEDIDECNADTPICVAEHYVNCTNSEGSYQCHCKPEWSGQRCEEDVDECLNNPCQNRGTCTNQEGSYVCACLGSYVGDNCETAQGACANNTCDLDHSYCETDMESYRCVCDVGYIGVDCDIDKNECASIPCMWGATCVDEVNGYTCTDCPTGYYGTHCEQGPNYCDPNPCSTTHSSSCIRLVDGYLCECNTGYTGHTCDTEVDECASSPCGTHGSCVDDVGRYECTCTAGYTGDTCETNIDECSSNPCQHGGVCHDGVNEYECECLNSFTGPRCETAVGRCRDVVCSENAVCTISGSGYDCQCLPGYGPTDCLQEINECESSPCSEHSSCIDEFSGYHCDCHDGYDGIHCENNIDDCASSPCQHQGMCVDGVGNYTCNCSTSYTGTNCETGIGPCAAIQCVANAVCFIDEDTGRGDCKCNTGYEGQNCDIDIDECATEPCSPGGICTDLLDDFSCLCHPGYIGELCDEEIDECLTNECHVNNTERCMDLVNGYYCQCLAGYHGTLCELDVTTTTPVPTTTIPLDTSIACPLAPDVYGAVRVREGIYANSITVYRCATGMWFSDDQSIEKTITCTMQGVWRPSDIGQCEVVHCPAVALTQGTLRSTHDTIYQTVVSYWCEAGYTTDTGYSVWTLQCMANGEWSEDVVLCHEHICPEIEEPQLTIEDINPVIKKITCPSYQLFSSGVPSRTIECTSEEIWTDDDFTCSVPQCLSSPYVPHSSVVLSADAAIATITCLSGYRFTNGLPFIVTFCENRDWVPNIDIACHPLTCPPVPVFSNATTNTDIALVNHTVTVTCDENYWFDVGVKAVDILCLVNRSWSVETRKCKEILCPVLPPVYNATLTDASQRHVGDLVTYTCNDDTYKFIHGGVSTEVICQEDGTWSVELSDCQPYRCAFLTLLYTDLVMTNASQGVTVSYQCIAGYRDVGYNGTTAQLTCSQDLRWDGNKLNCTEILCPDLSVIPYLYYSSTHRSIADVVNIHCREGYRLTRAKNAVGNMSMVMSVEMRCKKSGEWDYDITAPVCSEIVCPVLRPISYARSVSFSNTYNSLAIHSCTHGYTMPNRTTTLNMTCNATAQWDPVAPTCQIVRCANVTEKVDLFPNTSVNTYGTVLNYSCRGDLVLPENKEYAITTCTVQGEWIPHLYDCSVPSNYSVLEAEEAPNSQVLAVVGGMMAALPASFVVICDLISVGIKFGFFN